nr:hypothetical protein [Tanacetum cinerariifolium]
PKLRKNRTTHIDYIKHTLDEAASLREIVESKRLLSPLNTSLDYAYSKATSSVLNSMSNVNSDLKCASCNGCLFSYNHDACVVDYIKSVNASRKSKSVKTPVKRKVWKPTGRTFKLVGNVCPLTRIATPTIVPPREPIPIVNSMDKPIVTLKFLGTVKFGNDHVVKIMGYGDYQIRNVTISRVYYVEGLGHNLFSIGQFCDSDLEVAFCQHTCFIRNFEGVDLLTGSRGNNLYTLSLRDMMASSLICLLSKASKTKSWLWHRRLSHLNFGTINHLARQDNGTEFVNQTLRDYYEEVGISHKTSVARSPQQNGVIERCNRTLIEVAHTMLIYAQAPLFLWAEAVATACFTQNRSIIRLRHGKTSENLGKVQPKADIGIFIGYASTKKAFRIYNRCTRRIIETIHVDFDELTAMASEQSSSGPALNDMTPGTISSGLVPAEIIAPIAKVIPQVDANSIGSPSSTTVDQDAPSPSKSLTPTAIQSSVILQDVGNDNMDMEVAHMGNDSLLGVPFPKVSSDQSSSTAFPQSNVQPNHPIPHHNSKWTKDHPLNNIIGQLSRPVSTRLQLHEQALFCYYDAFLTSVEPKTYKEALTQACWIEAMQEELNEFERLEVWELVPRPDKV